jgi:hypothetical protein
MPGTYFIDERTTNFKPRMEGEEEMNIPERNSRVLT